MVNSQLQRDVFDLALAESMIATARMYLDAARTERAYLNRTGDPDRRHHVFLLGQAATYRRNAANLIDVATH